MQTQKRHVAILVDTATGWGRRLVTGACAWARQRGEWQLWLEPRGQDEELRLPPGWAGDGVIARVRNSAMARHLRRRNLPVVNVSGIEVNGVDFPRVTVDMTQCAELAVEHFLERGFTNFAYHGPKSLAFVSSHHRAFEQALARRGHELSTYRQRGAAGRNWSSRLRGLQRWLAALPKPVGVFTWATQAANEVLEACQFEQIDVPGQVAVLGGDDDTLFCSITTPPLSGLHVPSEQIGAEAARVLDYLMRGKPVPELERIAPVGISTRQSTDTLAIDDDEIAEAIRYIREHGMQPIRVTDILRAIPISRRSLERRFARLLGRSPAEELRRVRLERAVELLLTTELPIPQVADDSGFGSPQYFARVFASEYGMTPLKYRIKMRAT